jgi:type II secretory pathway component PulF
MLKMSEAWDLHLTSLEKVADLLQRTLPYWSGGLPLLVILWLVWTWHRSGLVGYGVRIHPLFRFGLLGALVRMRQAGELAALHELLAMLLEHGVPLPEALRLASAAVGSVPSERGAHELAERVERGEPLANPPAGFPPLLACLLASPHPSGELPEVLRRSAERYRDEAARRAQWFSLYFPILVTIVFAGGAVVLYAMLTFGPWLVLFQHIADQA